MPNLELEPYREQRGLCASEIQEQQSNARFIAICERVSLLLKKQGMNAKK
jgi:hypothetical protein